MALEIAPPTASTSSSAVEVAVSVTSPPAVIVALSRYALTEKPAPVPIWLSATDAPIESDLAPASAPPLPQATETAPACTRIVDWSVADSVSPPPAVTLRIPEAFTIYAATAWSTVFVAPAPAKATLFALPEA